MPALVDLRLGNGSISRRHCVKERLRIRFRLLKRLYNRRNNAFRRCLVCKLQREFQNCCPERLCRLFRLLLRILVKVEPENNVLIRSAVALCKLIRCEGFAVYNDLDKGQFGVSRRLLRLVAYGECLAVLID